MSVDGVLALLAIYVVGLLGSAAIFGGAPGRIAALVNAVALAVGWVLGGIAYRRSER